MLQVSSIEQKTNFLAAYVSAGLSAQLPQLMSQLGIKSRDSFEVGFNRATGLAAVGDMEAAATAVKAAYKQGEPKHELGVYTESMHPTVQQANGKGESKYEAHNGSIADDEHMMGQ